MADEKDPKNPFELPPDISGVFGFNKWYDPLFPSSIFTRKPLGNLFGMDIYSNPGVSKGTMRFMNYPTEQFKTTWLSQGLPEGEVEGLFKEMEKALAKSVYESFGLPPELLGEEGSQYSATSTAQNREASKFDDDMLKTFLDSMVDPLLAKGIARNWICVMPMRVASKLIEVLFPEKVDSWTMWDLEIMTGRETWITQTKSNGIEYCSPIYALATYYPHPFRRKIRRVKRQVRDTVMLGRWQL